MDEETRERGDSPADLMKVPHPCAKCGAMTYRRYRARPSDPAKRPIECDRCPGWAERDLIPAQNMSTRDLVAKGGEAPSLGPFRDRLRAERERREARKHASVSRARKAYEAGARAARKMVEGQDKKRRKRR